MYSVETLDRGVIHVMGGMERDGVRFHQTVQNSAYFKTYEFFISGILLLLFSNHGWTRVSETMKK